MHAQERKMQEKKSKAKKAHQEPVAEVFTERVWTEEIDAILDQAAQIAVKHRADLDQFMSVASEAYLRANPALREEIERAKMRAQMEMLRQAGILAEA